MVPCLFWGVVKGSLTNLCYFPKIANSIRCCFMVLYMIATLIWMLAVASVPPVYPTSQLDEGIVCVFVLGKLGNGEVFSSFDERRPA